MDDEPVMRNAKAEDVMPIKAFCLSNGAEDNLQVDDIRLFAGYVSSGTLTSPVHDAGGWADWGEISWDGEFPLGTDVILQTQTENTPSPST